MEFTGLSVGRVETPYMASLQITFVIYWLLGHYLRRHVWCLYQVCPLILLKQCIDMPGVGAEGYGAARIRMGVVKEQPVAVEPRTVIIQLGVVWGHF